MDRDERAHRVAPQDEVEAFLADGAGRFGDAAARRIETAGAVVFLTGDTALKIKKAVRFPFMDLSTPDRRRAAIEEEFILGRRYAPTIYRGFEPVRRRPGGALKLGPGIGEVLDWVLIMRRFDAEATFDRLAAADALTSPQIDALAEIVAASHRTGETGTADGFRAMLATTLEQNLEAFGENAEAFPPARVGVLDGRLRAMLATAGDRLRARAGAGFVKRCHGDLHLRNVAMIDGRPVLFDPLEFDPALATGDVLYDLAFLLMDLWHRGQRMAANRVLNGYLETARHDGADHLPALAELPLYLAVRATIRAKVTAAEAASAHGAEADALRFQASAYFDAAEAFASPPFPRLVAVGGLSGTGKTTLARALCPHLGAAPGAVLLRSDTERKALFDVPATTPLPAEAYTPEASAEVFRRLGVRAREALRAGHAVVVDAVFARREERAAIERVAIGESVRFDGLFLDAPLGIRLARVEGRFGDASDARADVAAAQENYDLGPMRWRLVDASGDPDMTLADARHALEGARLV